MMPLSGPDAPKPQPIQKFFRSGGHFLLMLVAPKYFSRKTKPDNYWHEAYSVKTRNDFLFAIAGACVGLVAAWLVNLLVPGPLPIVSKWCQFIGAAFGFAGAVGIPKPYSNDQETPAEDANSSGVFFVSLIAFALACFGVMVGP